MASNIIFYRLLSEKPYNLEKIRQFLERDHSSINKQGPRKKTPLVTVLENSECSIDIVRLLLNFGADVNAVEYGKTPLLTALEYSRDEAIIEALLRKGANMEVYDLGGRIPLCYIFTDCYRNQSPNPIWKENILNIFLQAGLDLNKVIDSGHGIVAGRSPLCFVLASLADVRDIELLLSKGASLNACQKHASPFHCVTDIFANSFGALLKANVVQLLLDKQACKDGVFEMDLLPLEDTLRFTQYETSAIRLLLEHSGENAVNTWIRQTNDVLHLVVRNRDCKTATVKLFLKRGACIDKLDVFGETVLHSFMTNSRKDLSVLDFLLKSGAPVNVKNRHGHTPLTKAVERGMVNYVISLLLAFGARFSILYDRNGISLLESALLRLNHNQESKCVFKTLVKYYFLEFPNFNVQRLIEGHVEHAILSVFVANCTDELHRMEAMNVRFDCTLRRFLSENLLLNVKTEQDRNAVIEDCDQLLKILSTNEFPEYFDVMASKMLASKVAEFVLESHLKRLIVFSFNAKINKRLGNAGSIKKVVLVHDVVCKKLAQFLSDEELLHLIVAFYNADDLPYNYNAPKKRNSDSEQITKFEKHRKLDQ